MQFVLNESSDRVAHFDQYCGYWAMSETHFRALAERASGLDLRAHLQEYRAGPGTDFDPEALMVQDSVAVIDVQGTLMKHTSSFTGGTSTTAIRKQLGKAMRDDTVSSIMLNIDSPGGTVAGTKEVADTINKARDVKPVVSFIEDTGASAAFWIASQADKVFSNATAQVGSIGTFGVVHDMSAMAAKEGIKVHVIRAGQFKGEGVPGAPISAEFLQDEQRIVNELNGFFLSAVAKGRGLTPSAVKQLADGRTHIGATAQSLGLTDGVKTFEQAFSFTRSQRRQHTMAVSAHVPAIYEELKATCIGADAEFLMEQLDEKNSVEVAQQEWMTTQQLRLEESQKQLAKAQLEATAVPAPKLAVTGVDPVPEPDVKSGTGEHGEAFSDWKEQVQKNMDRGMDRQKAVARAAKEFPHLREQMVAEYNITHSHLLNRRQA